MKPQDLIPQQAQQSAAAQALQQFKESLNNPKQLAQLLKNVIFKIHYEAHFDLLCIPRGKENPNHDYAILFRAAKDNQEKPQEIGGIETVIGNLIASNRLPLKINYRLVRKDGIVYTAVFLDVTEPTEAGES